jgi:ABC-2 type transport system permease protein
MAPPNPGFMSGFVPTLGRSLRESLRGKRALIFVLVLAIPPLLSLKATASPEHRVSEILPMIVLMLYLGFLVPMTGLLFGSGILRDETSGGTVPYLFTRPVPRSSIMLAKFLAAILLGGAGLAISLWLTLVQFGELALAGGFFWRAFVACLLALPAYLAALTFLSVILKVGVMVGFLYFFAVEGALAYIPGMMREVTLLFYSQSILDKPGLIDDDITRLLNLGSGNADLQTSILALVGVAVVFTILTIWTVGRREFVGKNVDAG